MIFFQSIFSVILGTLLFYGQVHAMKSTRDPRNLFVSIQNTGTENCQLIESTISKGKLHYNNIPLNLKSTGEKFNFIVHGYVVELTLKYNCGAHKSFSIYMKQRLKSRHKHTSIVARMLSAVDVFETHTTHLGKDCGGDGGLSPYDNISTDCESRAGKINWSITH